MTDNLTPSKQAGIAIRPRIFLLRRFAIGRFDFVFLLLLIFSVFVYHRNAGYWSGQTTIGNWQYGDAEFWWSGAIQFGEGIARDNPNLTYRMGYAIVAGLWTALFGAKFALFHYFLLVAFAVAWCALYFTVRPSLGSLGSAVGVLLFALNPFTAEWLAISTSDSLGLLFDTWMLIFLITGLRRNTSWRWLAASGLFLAFASLTRPLMTPFLVPAFVLPLLSSHVAWDRRIRAAAALLVAFLVPTLIWMGVLRTFTGSLKLAGSDAATFYAASDPQIQVWSPYMFEKVEASAKVRLHVAQVTPSQMDQEFWLLTLQNYRNSWRYHLNRAFPHFVHMADMSIDKASHVDRRSRIIRWVVLTILALTLMIDLVRRRAILRALGASVLIVALLSSHPALAVLLAAAATVPLAIWRRLDGSAAALTAYWCTGIASLYLVGGTFGPPLGATTAINALGYRLGAQFFFAADLMVLCLIHNLVAPRRAETAAPDTTNEPLPAAWLVERRWASRAVSVAFLIWLAFIAVESAMGGTVVAHRLRRRAAAVTKPFPDLKPVASAVDGRLRQVLAAPRLQVAPANPEALLTPNVNSPYVLVTGASTDFIWNLLGQDRATFLMSIQSRTYPFDFARRMLADVPSRLHEAEWTRRQGAWLLRRVADRPPLSFLPWYVTNAAVRAFIPLGDHGRGFDVGKALWFPVVKSASQLFDAKELIIQSGEVEWSGTSGAKRYPRRFALHSTENRPFPAIVVDAGKAVGMRNLAFRWQYELPPAAPKRSLQLRIRRDPPVGQQQTRAADIQDESSINADPLRLNTASFDLNHPPAGRIRIEFLGLRPGDTVWIYELNVVADDWEW